MAAAFITGDLRSDGSVRLDVEGDLDLAARSALVGHVDLLLDDSAVTGIVVDVAAVEFIDSSCIGALVGCKLNAEKPAGPCTSRGPGVRSTRCST